jgi:hypothetical protein
VKCPTDGNPDAKPSHRGVTISMEMNLVVLPGTEIKALNLSTKCPDKGSRLISSPQRWREMDRHKIHKEIRCKFNVLNVQHTQL